MLFLYQSGKKINSNPNPLVLLSVGHKAQESKVSSYFLYLALSTKIWWLCGLASAIMPLGIYTALKVTTRTEIANKKPRSEHVLTQFKLSVRPDI